MCRWEFEAPAEGGGGVKVVKRLALRRDTRAAIVDFTVTPARGVKAELRVRPLVSLRPFHTLQRRNHSSRQFFVGPAPHGCSVHRTDEGASLYISSSGAAGFEHEEQWWYDFVCTTDRARGQDCLEDLFSPGVLIFRPESRHTRIEGTIQFALGDAVPIVPIDEIERLELDRKRTLIRSVQTLAPKAPAPAIPRLVCAADDFVFARGAVNAERPVSIIAGFPWFADWGRDSMIALPGLLLITGRHQEALGVLKRFADARRNGIIPNRFGDEHGEPLYNTVDASLWFIVACAQYARASGDHESLLRDLLPACLDILEHYRRGTDHAIVMDPHDFLITAGSPITQLTWMDAVRDGVVFTPRHGKAVEINALWVCALHLLAEMTAAPQPLRSADLRALADARRRQLPQPLLERRPRMLLRHARPRRLGMARHPRRAPQPDLRRQPPPLPPHARPGAQRRRSRARPALHPHGPPHPRADQPGVPPPIPRRRPRARRRVPQRHRLALAPRPLRRGHHAGEPVLRRIARRGPRPARAHRELLDQWCIGQLPEVFDAEGTPEDPQRPGGCPAQAWSVAEVLRTWVMAEGG